MKLYDYHFDCGNSTKGAIGFCAEVRARNITEAVKLLNNALPKEAKITPVNCEGIGYINVYFGKVKALDVDDVERRSNE
jgi:hypothetical protein